MASLLLAAHSGDEPALRYVIHALALFIQHHYKLLHGSAVHLIMLSALVLCVFVLVIVRVCNLALSTRTCTCMHACRELFDSLDVDKSGQLDVAEITKLAKMFYGTTATTSSATATSARLCMITQSK